MPKVVGQEPGSRPDTQFFCLGDIILTAVAEGCLTKDKQHPEVSQGRGKLRDYGCVLNAAMD